MFDPPKVRRSRSYVLDNLEDVIAYAAASVEDAYRLCGVRDYSAQACVEIAARSVLDRYMATSDLVRRASVRAVEIRAPAEPGTAPATTPEAAPAPGQAALLTAAEVRHILFTPAEVLRAVMEDVGRPRADLATTELHLETCVAASGELRVRVLRPGVAVPVAEVVAADLAAVLVRLCQRRRIPLPRRARKQVALVGSRLCLTVLLGGGEAEGGAAEPDLMSLLAPLPGQVRRADGALP